MECGCPWLFPYVWLYTRAQLFPYVWLPLVIPVCVVIHESPIIPVCVVAPGYSRMCGRVGGQVGRWAGGEQRIDCNDKMIA